MRNIWGKKEEKEKENQNERNQKKAENRTKFQIVSS